MDSQSVDDLEAICGFIARDSSKYAQAFAAGLVNSVEKLRLFPSSGRVVPERSQENIREILFGSYRIVYRLHDDIAEILTIHHNSRLLDPSMFPSN